MFLKPYRVKTQTQLKGSEKKKLYAEILESFPNLTDEDLSKYLPLKPDITVSKIYCSKGEVVYIYQIQKEPLFLKFDKDNRIYPTIYFLWQFPNLVKTFTTYPNVIGKLQQGADLMLPGIDVKLPITPNSYGRFEKGTLVAINTSDNACPVAIGRTALSSMDMYMSARQGKGVLILHIYRDTLWEMGSKSVIPVLNHPEIVCNKEIDDQNETKLKNYEEDINEKMNDIIINEEEEMAIASTIEDVVLTGPEAMDELFLHCLLKACKTSMKKTDLPILTSNFYRLHMMTVCPDNKNLEIKKSSYKKLSKFLNEMGKMGLIEVKEFPKGVENLIGINYTHDLMKNFNVDLTETTTSQPDSTASSSGFSPPVLEELYQVSGTTIQFYRKCGWAKGDVLSRAEIREVITKYIDKNNLKRDDKVELDSVIHEAIINAKEGFKEYLRWDEIFSRFLGKMSPAFRISRNGEVPIIIKGKLEPIEMAIAKRSGNKKVTLIYNVGVFGIDENEFAHQVQLGVATSTSVGPAENKPQGTTQILVQGNHVGYIGKLLLETYKIPRKYIKGLELAKKSKK